MHDWLALSRHPLMTPPALVCCCERITLCVKGVHTHPTTAAAAAAPTPAHVTAPVSDFEPELPAVRVLEHLISICYCVLRLSEDLKQQTFHDVLLSYVGSHTFHRRPLFCSLYS